MPDLSSPCWRPFSFPKRNYYGPWGSEKEEETRSPDWEMQKKRKEVSK